MITNLNLFVVIYNTLIENSSLFQNINMNPPINVFIFDNSTNLIISSLNKINSDSKKYHYYSEGDNLGLSKAYNYLINKANLEFNKGWVILLDQDSIISKSFFKSILSSISNFNEVKIHLPNVYYTSKGRKILLSPKVKVSKSFSAINSGMVMRYDLFDLIGKYNDKLFLDFVDNDFIDRYNKLFNSFINYNETIIQDFSGSNQTSLSNSLFRFSIFLKDSKVYYGRKFHNKIYRFIRCFYRAFKLCFTYKTIKFGIIFIKYL
jgi:rhamnosyltransferase